MFETSKDYKFNVLSDTIPSEVRLGPGDQLTVQVLTNDGYTMLTPGLESPQGGFNQRSSNVFEVDLTGKIRLPFIDTLNVTNLTIRETEHQIEKAFEVYFKQPFAQVKVINRRAFIFPGSETGLVVPLNSENISLIEVIAQAGGIPPTGKAYNVKLIRSNGQSEYEVALINLRDIEELNKTDIYIQHRDIIYIEPTFQTTLLTQLTPIFGVFSTIIGFATLFVVLRR